MLPYELPLWSCCERDRETSTKLMNRFDVLSWLQNEVQSTGGCFCERSETTGEWVKS